MSLEFVRKTVTFRTSSFNFHLFSHVFASQHVRQNDVLGKMSPFLEHLSVPKGCQQARLRPSGATSRSSIGLEKISCPPPLRAAARSLSFRSWRRRRKAGNNPVGGPDKPAARDVKGIHATSRAPYSPACLSAGLAAASGTEAGSITMRLLDRPTSEVGAGTPRVEGWRAAGCGGLDIYHRESEKKIF